MTTGRDTPANRSFPICEDHRNADWNQPALDDDTCVLCRLFYLEAQESLLEEWQERAKRAEDAIAETQRPLDAQMARLNATVERLNEENERLAVPRALADRLLSYARVQPDRRGSDGEDSGGAAMKVTDEMVDRFLSWPLPKSVCADGCATHPDYPHPRSGTNLLTAIEARAMLEHVMSDKASPSAVPDSQPDDIDRSYALSLADAVENCRVTCKHEPSAFDLEQQGYDTIIRALRSYARSASGDSKFSEFIRNATPEEKEAVYTDVMKRATERQNACRSAWCSVTR
ncbi:MAG TPA: hypothetical protein VFA81_11945, partial [Burkholderiales bacterium]|nr:hypothetical protein [Burkholderiales bacterium]